MDVNKQHNLRNFHDGSVAVPVELLCFSVSQTAQRQLLLWMESFPFVTEFFGSR